MNITKSNIHIMLNDKIYTLLQKDEDSKIKFKHNDNIINIATKDDVIENMNHIDYKDEIKIYYYLYEQYIQLAIYEDIIEYKCHEISFNNIEYDNIQHDDNFNTIKQLNVRHIIKNIDFSINNETNNINTDGGIKLKTNDTSIERHIIDYSNDTELVSSSNTNQSSLGYILNSTTMCIERYIVDYCNDTELVQSPNINQHQLGLGCTFTNTSLDIVRTTFDLTSPNDLDKNNTMVDLVNTSLIWEEVEYNG